MKKVFTSFLFLSIILTGSVNAFRPMSSSLQNINTNSVPTMQKPTIAVDEGGTAIREKVDPKNIKVNPFTSNKLILKSINLTGKHIN